MDKKAEKLEKLNKVLDEEVDPKFLRRELIVINNILTSLEYKLGDAAIVIGILHKIKPLAAVDSNITKEESDKQKAEANAQTNVEAELSLGKGN